MHLEILEIDSGGAGLAELSNATARLNLSKHNISIEHNLEGGYTSTTQRSHQNHSTWDRAAIPLASETMARRGAGKHPCPCKDKDALL